MKEHVKDSQEEFFLAWWPKGGIIDRLIIEIYCNSKMSDKILRITMARKVGNVRAKGSQQDRRCGEGCCCRCACALSFG